MTPDPGRVLLVLTDPVNAKAVRRDLAARGHQVTATSDGGAARRRAAQGPVELVILDREAGGDGLQLLSAIHRAQPWVPIIVLAANPTGADCVECLDRGAIDYVPAMIAPEELAGRVRAHLRVRLRDAPTDPGQLHVGDMELNRVSRRLSRGRSEITLTPRECDILAYMMQHAGLVISRTRLHRVIWGYDSDPGTNVVEVYVGYLRRKLGHPSPIKTVRGRGYRLAD